MAPQRLPRIAARWLRRYLEERDDPTIDEAAMVASCLVALGGARHQEAERTLRGVAERATSRGRGPRLA